MKSTTAIRLAGALLVLPLLGMSTSAFAATRPTTISPVPMTASATRVAPRHPYLTQPHALATTVGQTALTASQLSQAVAVANASATTASNGAVTVSATTLGDNGLSTAQIQWVESQMTSFDAEVQAGTVPAPVSNGVIPAGLLATLPGAPSNTDGEIVAPFSTGNMAFSWYISNNPYYLGVSKWYGTLWVMNNTGTNLVIQALNKVAAGATYTGAAAAALSFIPGSTAVSILSILVGFASTGTGALVNSVNTSGGDFGVNFPSVLGVVPVWLNANDPD